jgi:hypothetical protein
MILILFLRAQGDQFLSYFNYSIHRMKLVVARVHAPSGIVIKMQFLQTGSPPK